MLALTKNNDKIARFPVSYLVINVLKGGLYDEIYIH